MNGIEVLKKDLLATQKLLEWYVADLSDADLLVRPAPNANHIAWQIGNVILGDKLLIQSQYPDATFPELPETFATKHGPAGAHDEGSHGFLTKAEYLETLSRVRGATIAQLETLTEADLDQATPQALAEFAPTVGDLFLAVANHTLMHAGQFSVIRRVLDKPVLM